MIGRSSTRTKPARERRRCTIPRSILTSDSLWATRTSRRAPPDLRSQSVLRGETEVATRFSSYNSTVTTAGSYELEKIFFPATQHSLPKHIPFTIWSKLMMLPGRAQSYSKRWRRCAIWQGDQRLRPSHFRRIRNRRYTKIWIDELDYFHHDCHVGHTGKSIHLKASTRRPRTYRRIPRLEEPNNCGDI